MVAVYGQRVAGGGDYLEAGLFDGLNFNRRLNVANKKFELTAEINAHGCFRIRALIDFSDVKAGDLGGFVSREASVDESGDAWVYGNAQVSGDARVYGNARVYGSAWVSGNAQVSGNARVSKSLIQINGLRWIVTINDVGIQIGCEHHSTADWDLFDDSRIAQMSDDAVDFWKKYKQAIIDLANVHQGRGW